MCQPFEEGTGGAGKENVRLCAGVVDRADRGIMAPGELGDAVHVRDIAGNDPDAVRRQVVVLCRVTHDRGHLVTSPACLVDCRPSGPASRAENNDLAHPKTSLSLEPA